MAEYAGLEIRIGGNTSSLNNALKSSTKSAAELQSRIRQVTRAMQFDPTSLGNVDTRIRLTGQRMESLQVKAQLVQKAMEQLGAKSTGITEKGVAKTVQQIAQETDNLSLSAKQADERFVELRDTLAKAYEIWNRAARKKGVDFLRDTLGIDEETAERLMSTKTGIGALVDELREIKRYRESIGDNLHVINPEDIERVKQLKQLDFHGMFERGVGLDDMVARARDLAVEIDGNVVEAVREMRGEFVKAQQEKAAFDDALQFEQLGVDAQRIESEIVGLSNTIRELGDNVTNVSRGADFQQLESQLRTVDTAAERVSDDLERTERALELDPGNIDLAVRRFSDLREQLDLSEDRAETLRRQLSLFDTSEVSEAVAEHRDLSKWIEEAAEAARQAEVDWRSSQATVSNLSDQVTKLEQHIATLGKSAATASMTEEVEKYERALAQLAEAEEEVIRQESAHAAAGVQLHMVTTKAEEATAAVEQLDAEYRAFEKSLGEWQAYMHSPGLSADEVQYARDQIRQFNDLMAENRSKVADARKAMGDYQQAIGVWEQKVKSAETAVGNAKAEVSKLRTDISKLEETGEVKAFKNFDEEVSGCRSSLERLKGDLEAAKDREEELAKAYKSANTENNLAKSTKKVKELELGVADAENAARSAKEAMEEFGNARLIQPSTLKSIGMTLSATLTPLLTGVGYSMLDASSTVDAAYRDMRKTVDATEEQFEDLREAAINFSRTHVTSADQILQIEAIGGELGVAVENLETFAEVVSNIDVATNLDTEGAATALGHLANVLHLTEEDYVGFSDALVRLGNNGASTETEIANIAERIGAMGAIVGMSAPDVLAWASSIASTGQNAEAAGTAISKTMSFFETAVAAAGGTIDASFGAIDAAVQEGGSSLVVFSNLMGQTAEEFAQAWETDPTAVFDEITAKVDEAKGSLQGIADVAGMTADEFAKTWDSDPTAAMEAFIKGLNGIEASGGSADAVLQQFGITSVRQKQAIEGLMQTIDGLDNNLQMSENAWNGISDQWGEAGDAANEAAKKAEGFSGQIQIMKNMWQIFLSELGEGAVPIIKTVSGALEGLSSWFSSLGQSTKTSIVMLGGFATALGPLLSMKATFSEAVINVKKWAAETLNATALVKSAFAAGGEEAVLALTGAMTGATKAKLIFEQLALSMSKTIMFGAAIAGVAILISELNRARQEMETHIAATKGLMDALDGVGKSSSVAAGAFGTLNISIGALSADAGEYEERLASLKQTIEDSNKQFGNYSGQLSYYADTISELGGKAELTEGETYKLKAALEAVNEECGTTYGLDQYGNIIDTQTGKVQEQTDVINANIEARRQQALIDYYSDDYSQAVGEYAEAQDKLNVAQEEYNKLISDAGRQAYFDHAKEVYGAAYDEAKVQAAYNLKVEKAAGVVQQYTTEVDAAGKVVETLDGKIAGATDSLNNANKVIEDAAKAQQELEKRTATVTADVTGNMKRLSDALTTSGGTDADFNSIAEGLEAIHVYAEEMNDVDMSRLVSSFNDVGYSMNDVIAALEEGGVQMTTWNSALESAPGAAENMGSVTAAAFQSMYEVAGSSLEGTMTLIAGLDTVEVGDKTFYVGDNGSIIDEQGRVYDLDKDLADIPDEVITTLAGEDSDLRDKILTNKQNLIELDQMSATPTIGVVDYASAKIDYINSKLSSLANRYTSTTISASTQATGGMNGRPVIPRHATGYIATGPTLTNQGWIGEDGVEAVANWATGGAVVPLTNKRYMLPIADAIASGMAERGYGRDSGTHVTVNLNYSAGEDANQLARDLARAISMHKATRGRW